MPIVFDPPIHPGEILREQFMEPMGLSAGKLAKALDVPRTRIERIAAETMGISADTALRLAKYFGTSAELWAGLQIDYELATEGKKLKPALDKIETHDAKAA